ncbi:MAG TPA: EAL domain-containing protein [Candidatus Eremiobacteraceae bacterium]
MSGVDFATPGQANDTLTQVVRATQKQAFQQFFAGVGHAVFACDVNDGTILDANDEAITLFGYARRKLLTLKLADVLASEEDNFIRQSLRRERGMEPRVARFRIIDVDGLTTPVEGFATPVSYAGRRATLISLTRSKAGKQERSTSAAAESPPNAPALLQRIRRQKALIEFAKAAISDTSPIDLTRRGARLLRDGLGVDFVLGFEYQATERVIRCIAADGWVGDLDSMSFDPDGDSLAAKALRSRGVFSLLDIDDANRPADSAWFLKSQDVRSAIGIPVGSDSHDYGSLVAYDKGAKRFSEDDLRFSLTVASVIAIASEAVEARSSAVEAAERLSEVLASIVEHFVHVDRQWNIRFVNVTVETLFARRADELVGQPIASWFPSFGEQLHRQRYEDAMYRNIASQFEFRSSLNDHWYEARVRPTPEGIAVYFLDITTRRLAEERRLEDEGRVRRLVDGMPAILWMTDKNLVMQMSAGGALMSLGLPDNRLTGLDLREMMNNANGPTIVSHERALGGESSGYVDTFGGRTYEGHVEPTRDASGAVIGVAGLCIDVTERMRLEETLAEAQTLAKFGTWTYDRDSGERTSSDELLRIVGRSREETPPDNMDLRDIVHPDDAAHLAAAQELAKQKGDSWNLDHRIVRSDGSVRHVQNVGRYMYDKSGVPTRGFGSVLDITERKLAENELVRLANFDVLTDLPNRTQLNVRLSESMVRAVNRGKLVALCCLDIDRFKNINDTLGHTAGDALLKAVGGRLTSVVRRGDTVARLGSDEFAIVFADVTTDYDLTLLADKVISAFASPFEISERELFASASVGFSVFPGDATDGESLIRQADSALYKAKETGGGQVAFFNPDMHADAGSRLEFQNSLYRALGRSEFRLHFQPIVGAASRQLHGFEALIRWQHPTLGMVPPDRFIPLAEQTGLIIPIGDWVLREACAEASRWHGQGSEDLWISINVSARQFSHPDLVSLIAEVLESSGLPAARLWLEVTESAVVRDIQSGARTIKSLRAMGVKIAIDDFGTGYSSFGYLRSFAFDTFKIDRSFTRGLPETPEDVAITRGMIALGHALGMSVTAEGVETEAQARCLEDASCDALQGYFIGTPGPIASFKKWLPSVSGS